MKEIKMKLIAVGTTDPNPDNWKSWDEVELYIAKDLEQAIKMAGYFYGSGEDCYPAVEVDMTIAKHLMTAPDYVED